jgi:hypothetical protein
MAYKNQSKRELEIKNKRNYIYEHKNTREIEGFNDLERAKTIATSPSWIPVSDKAKALTKKQKAKEAKAKEPVTTE